MKEDPLERSLGSVKGCRTYNESIRFARDHWKDHVITRLSKVRGTKRYGGEYKVFGRPRRRRR